jgi:hypothetical protein
VQLLMWQFTRCRIKPYNSNYWLLYSKWHWSNSSSKWILWILQRGSIHLIKILFCFSAWNLVFAMDFDLLNWKLASEKLLSCKVSEKQRTVTVLVWNIFLFFFIQKKNGKLTEIYVNLGLIFIYWNQVLSLIFSYYCTKLE